MAPAGYVDMAPAGYVDMGPVLTAYPGLWRVLAPQADGREATRSLHLWPLLNESSHCNVLHLLVQPVVLNLDTPVQHSGEKGMTGTMYSLSTYACVVGHGMRMYI